MGWCARVLQCCVVGSCAATALAAPPSDSQGFIEGGSLNVLLRNTYWNRDYNRGVDDRNTWAQGMIGRFESGFTQGAVGMGVDAFGLMALRFDGGQPDMFPGERKHWSDDTSQLGFALKFRWSATTLSIGDQMPSLPVLNYGDSRLLPQSFTGLLLNSREIDGLELNIGHFSAQSSMESGARDSSALKRIDVAGGSYQLSDHLMAALYFSDVEDVYKKKYLNLNYTLPLSGQNAVNVDFNWYRTRYSDETVADRFFFQGILGDHNDIWSVATKFTHVGHTVSLSYEQSSGDVGYAYDLGDGGSTIWLANGYYADFSQKGEKSVQVYHEWDFAGDGVPGLKWRIAYIYGYDIDAGAGGTAREREFFNQLGYTVQSGAARDLSFRIRNSVYRNTPNDSGYSVGLNEWRLYAEYPVNLF